MKKKVLALITVFVMLMGLVGCSSEGLTLLSEMKKVSSWEALEETGTISCTVEAMGVKANAVAEYEAYSKASDIKQKMSINFKEFTVEDSASKSEMNLKLSPVEVYMEGMRIYVSTNYITELCGFAGVDATSFIDTTKEFVALDMNDMMAASGLDLTNMNELMEQSYSMYENSKVELPITKKGSTYTITMNADQMLEAFVTFCNESMQDEMVTEQYKAMGLTEEQIQEAIATAIDAYAEMKETLKPYIQGSTAEISYTFAGDSYTTTANFDFKVSVEGEEVKMNMKLTDEVKKATVKEVTFPTSVTVYSLTDIMESLMSSISTTVVVDSKDIVPVNGVSYVPFRAVMEQVGLEVQFDNTTKKTSIVLPTGALEVETILRGNTSYVSVQTLNGLGISLAINE